jgi:dipeptidyl aminopeptidase/acylaminoacyl peptidase
MPEDTHEDVRRRLFEAAWEVPTFAPAPKRTVGRARRRAAMTISGAIAGAAVAATAVILTTGGILGMEGEKTAIAPSERDPREYLVNVTTGQRTEFREMPRGAWLYDLSPDGSQLAFVADTTGSNQVWVMNMDGSGLRQITDDAYEGIDPTWSPDGRRIAYVGFGEGTNRDLFVVDVATGKTRPIVKGPRDPWNPQWSPEGEHLLYYELIKVDPSEGATGNLTPNPTSLRVSSVEVATRRIKPLAGGTSFTHAWDGTWAGHRILFIRERFSARGHSLGLWLMNGDGSRKEFLLSFSADDAFSPAMAPDGSRIAYTRIDGSDPRIHIFDLSTSQDRPIAPGEFAIWVDDDTLLVQEILPPYD